MFDFTPWLKSGVEPRLYFSPNTEGRAFLSLSNGENGVLKLNSQKTSEKAALIQALSSSGLDVKQTHTNFDAFTTTIENAGHSVIKFGRKAPAKRNIVDSAIMSKEDFCNTDTPSTIHLQTLKYSLASIKFLRKTDKYTITVDTREPLEISERLTRSGISVVTKKLDVGDIRITTSDSNDELIFERKTVSDLYSSIVGCTAHRQAECLFEYQAEKAQEGIRVMVVWLIEGELNGQRMLYNAFPNTNQTDGVINLLTAILGQHVIQCYGQHHLCYLAVKFAQGYFEQELVYKVKAAERKSRTPATRRSALIAGEAGEYHGIRTQDKNPLLQILLAIPSIKEPVAKAIIAKGHKFSDVLRYSETDWLSFAGVGKVLAARLVGELKDV